MVTAARKMLVYQKISDSISQEKKNSLAGQMSLFDLVSEEDKKEFEIRMPDVEESEKRNFWDMRRKFWESTSVVILWKITGK